MTVVGKCVDCLYGDPDWGIPPTMGSCRDCVDSSNYKDKDVGTKKQQLFVNDAADAEYVSNMDRLRANSNQSDQSDPINPQHYKQYAVEVIDLIRQALTPEEFKGYLKGNMLKYRFRAGYKKDREEDLEKSNWYQDKLATD